MAIESAADLAHMLDGGAFGATATVDGVSVAGIFDADYVETDFSGVSITGAAPMLLVREADVAAAAVGDAVVVNAVSYSLRRIEPDGTGLARLILTAA